MQGSRGLRLLLLVELFGRKVEEVELWS